MRVPGSQTTRRRGSMYFMVLGTALLLTVIGLSAVTAARIQQRGAREAGDLVHARLNARTAVELAVLTMNTDANWRTSNPNGTWVDGVSFGSGSYSIEVYDPDDDNLADDANDHVIVVGTGAVGKARYRLAMELSSSGAEPLSCLESALHAFEQVYNYSSMRTDGEAGANTNFYNYNYINGDVLAGGFVYNFGTITGAATERADTRTMPDAATVLEHYAESASALPSGSLEAQGQSKGVLLSATENPFGQPNAAATYYVDGKGKDLTISNLRLVGTLVILDAGVVTISDGILMEPAQPQYPVLIVEGDVVFQVQELLEETVMGRNYNPPGTPFEGVEDSDETDIYSSGLNGLVYVTGSITNNNRLEVNGCILAGYRFTNNNQLQLDYDTTLPRNPPPGFRGGSSTMAPMAGTVRPVVD
jgi:hypothetical protein